MHIRTFIMYSSTPNWIFPQQSFTNTTDIISDSLKPPDLGLDAGHAPQDT